MKTATKIEYRWDEIDPANPGWYAVSYDASGEVIDDSMKIWWPVDVDEFGADQGDELGAALRKAYPGAEIVAA